MQNEDIASINSFPSLLPETDFGSFCNHFKTHNKGENLMTSLRGQSLQPTAVWLPPLAVDIVPLLHYSITVQWAVPGVRLVRVAFNSH